MRTTLLLILTLIAIPSFSIAKDKDVVATVNGKKITQREFDNYFKQRLLFVTNKKLTRENILNELINKELGIQYAKKQGIDKDPIVQQKLEEVMYHAQISKDLDKEFRKIKVTDKDVEEYYKTNKEYRTAHILTRVRANPDAEEVKKALQASVDIYNQALKDPEKFSELASKFSQTNVSQIGGDLGYQPPTKYAPEYFAAIQGKAVGYISKPVRSQYGFHVIKVLGIKKYADINKNLYKKIIYDIKRDKIIKNYHAGLRKNAKVKIQLN